jgi:hypothetical protein
MMSDNDSKRQAPIQEGAANTWCRVGTRTREGRPKGGRAGGGRPRQGGVPSRPRLLPPQRSLQPGKSAGTNQNSRKGKSGVLLATTDLSLLFSSSSTPLFSSLDITTAVQNGEQRVDVKIGGALSPHQKSAEISDQVGGQLSNQKAISSSTGAGCICHKN